jgi:hypothetical protein
MSIHDTHMCVLCGYDIIFEDGFLQCECLQVDYYYWDLGVLDTPEEWIEKEGE